MTYLDLREIGEIGEIFNYSPPLRLFHYSTYQGFYGIVQNKSLWATSIYYLNDASEFSHAIEIARTEINDAASRRSENAYDREFFEKLRSGLNSVERVYIYVCCFSEKDDLLSQWRAYARPAGVTLGFTSISLNEIASKFGFRMIKCLYDDKRKEIIVRSLVDRSFNLYSDLEESSESNPENQAEATRWFLENFLTVAPAFKHSAFSEEAEWRLVSDLVPYSDSHVKFRPTSGMIIPYYELSLDVEKSQAGTGHEFALDTVTIGPTPHMELSSESILALIRKNKLPSIRVQRSRAPYRDL